MSNANPSPLQRSVYVGTFVHCPSLNVCKVLENTAVGVDETGKIAFIEENASNDAGKSRAEDLGWIAWDTVVIGGQDSLERGKGNKGVKFWFPGFIDTHIHASQYPNAGVFGNTTLLSWLEKYTFPLEASLASLRKAQTVYSKCIRKTLANGTTTAAYYAVIDAASTNVLADVCLAAGQRAFIGRCNMDSHIHKEFYRDTSAKAALESTRATIDHISQIDPSNRLLTAILTPRFAPSCTPELLKGLGELQKATGLPIQTHISENKAEVALVAETFKDHASYAGVYDSFGLLGPRTVLAHACHLSPEEVSLVAERGASISHCPISNSSLGSGVCPVRELLDRGISLGLGTDVSGGYAPSILAAAREAAIASRYRSSIPGGQNESLTQEKRDQLKLSVEETLFLATRGGARCLGLEKKVGHFEVGMEWDAQLVDLGTVVGSEGWDIHEEIDGGVGGVQLWEGNDWEEILAKWVYCGDDRNTRAVWVAGKLVSGIV